MSFFLIIAAVLLYGAVHSILASFAAKEYAVKLFGKYGEKGYRIFYNIFAVITLVPVFMLARILPDRLIYQIPYPWVLATSLIQILAALVVVYGIIQTGFWQFAGLKQLAVEGEEKDSKLVIHGLYCYVRHPLYTAGLVFLWLSPEMSVNTLALVIGLSVYLVIGAVVEEKKLVREYGQAYQRYQQMTPMLVPRIHKCAEGNISDIH